MRATLATLVLLSSACSGGSVPTVALISSVSPRTGFEGLNVVELSREAQPGQPVAFSDRLQRSAVVELWASWCAPCRETMPETAAAVARVGTDEVQWLPVSLDEDPDSAVAFLRSTKLDTTPLLAASSETWREQLGISGLPLLLVVDPQGVVLDRIVGVGPDTSASLERALQHARERGGAGAVRR